MIKLFLSSLILICLICTDYQYANLTFEISNVLTIDLQHFFKKENSFIEFVIQFFSFIGDRTIMQFIMILIWLKSRDIIEAIKILIMYSISSYTVDLIKMIIQQPRPFYTNNNIQLAFCHTGFGGPSGHACRALVFYYIIFKSFFIQNRTYDCNANYNDISQSIDSQSIQYVRLNYTLKNRLLYYVGLQFFIILTGLARLYFGIHFLNQIIQGWIIGFYLLYIYYKCGFEDYLEFHLNIVIKQQAKQKISIRLGLFLTFVILVLMSFLCYYICLTSDSLQEMKNKWIIFVNQQKLCYGSDQKYYNSFEKHDIIGTSIITLPFFIYFMLRLNNNDVDIKQYKISSFLTKEGLFKVILLLTLILVPIYFRRYIKSYVLQNDSNIILEYILVGIMYFLQTSVVLLILFPFFSNQLKKRSCFNQQEINLATQEIEL